MDASTGGAGEGCAPLVRRAPTTRRAARARWPPRRRPRGASQCGGAAPHCEQATCRSVFCTYYRHNNTIKHNTTQRNATQHNATQRNATEQNRTHLGWVVGELGVLLEALLDLVHDHVAHDVALLAVAVEAAEERLSLLPAEREDDAAAVLVDLRDGARVHVVPGATTRRKEDRQHPTTMRAPQGTTA